MHKKLMVYTLAAGMASAPYASATPAFARNAADGHAASVGERSSPVGSPLSQGAKAATQEGTSLRLAQKPSHGPKIRPRFNQPKLKRRPHVKRGPSFKHRSRGHRRSHRRGWHRGLEIGAGIAILGLLAAGAAKSSGYQNAMRKCDRRFRSFDWDSGTYVTYGGEVRLCPYLEPYVD